MTHGQKNIKLGNYV